MVFFFTLSLGKSFTYSCRKYFFCILYIWSIYLNICIYYYKLQYLRPTYFHKILSFSSLTSIHLLSLIISYIATWFNPKDFWLWFYRVLWYVCSFYVCVIYTYIKLYMVLHLSLQLIYTHVLSLIMFFRLHRNNFFEKMPFCVVLNNCAFYAYLGGIWCYLNIFHLHISEVFQVCHWENHLNNYDLWPLYIFFTKRFQKVGYLVKNIYILNFNRHS